MIDKYSTKSRVLVILAISLAVTLVLSVSMSNQVWGAALGAPTNVTQCVAATETTISLCWTNPSGSATLGGTGAKSFFIENVTETCANTSVGDNSTFTCTFGTTYRAALTGGIGQGGTNQTGGTGSNIAVVNFTGLTSGQMFKFKIYANNAHGNGTASAVFQAGTLLGANQNYADKGQQSFANGTTFGSRTSFAANQDFGNFQNFGANQEFGAGTGFAQDQTFNGTQDFSAGSIKFDSGTQFSTVQDFGAGANFTGATTFTGANTFGASATFGKNADFSIGAEKQTFGSAGNFSGVAKFGLGEHVFGASTLFAQDQTFNGTKDFSAGSIKFDSGTQFSAKQDFGAGANFTGATTFKGTNTFGASTVFGKNADFSIGGDIQTFGSAGNFSGVAKFGLGEHVFGASSLFAEDQTFDGTKNFSAADMKFGGNTQFSALQEFGSGANFTGAALFTGANIFGTDAIFGKGTNFPAGQTFGQAVNFTGTAIFGDTQIFPTKAEFAEGQIFDSGGTYTFDDFALFRPGTDFGVARTFDVGTMFESTMTFTGLNSFSKGTVFGDSQAFSVAQDFASQMNFGANTDFTDAIQTFYGGTTFEEGVQFRVDQIMPIGTVPPSGLMLAAYTCEDTACVPPAGSILSPGEFLPRGTDPVEILSAVSASEPSVSIPGLGFVMNFTTVTGNGSTSIDPIDPALLPGSAAALRNTASSSSSIVSGAGSFDTIGTALNIELAGAGISGDITITMPYDEGNIASGVNESDLVMLHYVGDKWVQEDSCTVDTDANSITCTAVSSLSPFTIGNSISPRTGGGGNCDANGFGPGKSLALYEINWDILEANEVVVIASSTCGPIDMQVFSQKSRFSRIFINQLL